MAKRKQKGSVSGYFRTVFDSHPEWLKGKSNAPLLAQYRTDHGLATDSPVPKNIVSNLANLKSNLRKKGRKRTGSKMISVKSVASPSFTKLEALEELIDECLTMAKNLDRTSLEHVIRNLRRARNEVVWKIGQ
jgi:hypothetical protein